MRKDPVCGSLPALAALVAGGGVAVGQSGGSSGAGAPGAGMDAPAEMARPGRENGTILQPGARRRGADQRAPRRTLRASRQRDHRSGSQPVGCGFGEPGQRAHQSADDINKSKKNGGRGAGQVEQVRDPPPVRHVQQERDHRPGAERPLRPVDPVGPDADQSGSGTMQKDTNTTRSGQTNERARPDERAQFRPDRRARRHLDQHQRLGQSLDRAAHAHSRGHREGPQCAAG